MSKIHKNNCPLRPVVSMINTPEYNISRYLDNLIKPVIPKTYMLDSNKMLLNDLKDFSPNSKPNHILVSFDVDSLFTNVPLKETIDICANYVYSNENEKQPPFSKSIFIKLMEKATGGIFQFNGSFYKQCDGVTMGGPLGPTLANIFLAHLEKSFMVENFSLCFIAHILMILFL